jgi:hypothetical protein
MRPQAGVDRLKPVPPMHANDLPWWGRRFRLPTAFFLTFSGNGFLISTPQKKARARTCLDRVRG